MVVLMERKSFNLYHQYQQDHPEKTTFPPCLVLMTSYVDNRIAKLKNATGIRYEIQGVTGLSHLRSLVKNPIQTVGGALQLQFGFLLQNTKGSLPGRGNRFGWVSIEGENLRQGKRDQTRPGTVDREQRVHALWVLNETAYWKSPHLDWGWFPALRALKARYWWVWNALHWDKVGLGQFAIVPDHTGLGNQAANMIFEIRDAGWSVADFPVRRPYSVNKKINLKKVPKSLAIE